MCEYEVILILPNLDTDSHIVILKIKITSFDLSFYLILLGIFFILAFCNL